MQGRIAHYVIERELGRGGMGVVYAAQDERLGRRVAIKRLLAHDPEARRRFELEATALARLRHANVVSIHEVGAVDGDPYLVMDLVEGESLQVRLDREGPLPAEAALPLAEQLAQALVAAHAQGVLHRDLKPANVLLSAHDGRALVTDFGLALDARSVRERLTQTGQILGTPAYMAPEQAEGDPEQVGARADVYAAGATLYAAMTGRAPFEGPEVINILASLLTKSPPPPSALRPEVDRDLETIILCCLEKDPDDRYASALELRDDIHRWARGEALVAARPGSLARLWRRARKRRRLLTFLALGAALAAGLTAALVHAQRRALELQGDQFDELQGELSAGEVSARERRAARERAAARRREAARTLALTRQEQRAARQLAQAEAAGAREQWETAIRILEPALAQLPAESSLRPQLASALAEAIYQKTLGIREPIRMLDLDRALELDPEHVSSLRERAKNVRHPKGVRRFEDLLKDADEALRLGGPHAETLAYRAGALMELGRLEEALESCDRALQLNDRNDSARFIRGQVLFLMGRWADARDAFSYSLKLGHGHRKYRLRGRCHLALGEEAEARLDYERALRVKGNYADAWRDVAALEEQRGDLDAALGALNEALTHIDDAVTRLQRARLHAKRGDHQAVLADLDALELDPNDPRAEGVQRLRERARAELRRAGH